MKSHKRILSIDILKAIGIILMIMGHIGFGNKFDFYIHGFHMPLFFFISGYLFNSETSFNKILIKKLKTLIVPYLSFGGFYFLYVLSSGEKQNIYNYVQHFLFNNNELPNGGALWFLTALFFANIIFCGVLNQKIRKYTITIILICFAMILLLK